MTWESLLTLADFSFGKFRVSRPVKMGLIDRRIGNGIRHRSGKRIAERPTYLDRYRRDEVSRVTEIRRRRYEAALKIFIEKHELE